MRLTRRAGLQRIVVGCAMLCAPQAWASDGAAPAMVGGGPRAVETATILSNLSQNWFKGEWAAYRAKFVSADGRVIDNANGDVSHSEGQGYGLLLALSAGDAAAFDTIWRWTAGHLQKRSDALFAWKWDPRDGKAVDLNNASDGDVLIAWALAKAAKRFARQEYEAEARRVVRALAAKVVVAHGKDVLLLPGAAGFGAGDQPAGPVVNLSYWVFAAFPDLAPLAPQADWAGLRQSGLRLLDASRFGPRRLPSDWIALGGTSPAPAARFPAQFGYDGIRIPLYLAQDPGVPRETLARFAALDGPGPLAGGPAVIDTGTGAIRQPMPGSGYRMVYALARCATSGDTIPPQLLSTRDTDYYPETLRLLSISIVQERLSQCL